MNDRKCVKDDAVTVTHQIGEHNGPTGDSSLTQVCADAETAQTTNPVPKRTCPSWCVTHDPDGDVCHAEELESGSLGVGLTYARPEGARIHVAGDNPLTVQEGAAYGRAILAQVNKAVGPKRDYDSEMPQVVKDHAAGVGHKAAVDFRSEWRAEMRAHEFERQEAESGTRRPVPWLVEDPCPSWCVGGLDHDNGTHPDDRAHYSSSEIVPLVTMPPVVVSFPAQFAPPTLTMSLDQRYREREARVCFQIGDSTALFATLNEAEKVAHHLLDLVQEARGLASRPCLDEACPDAACHFCNPVPASAVAST